MKNDWDSVDSFFFGLLVGIAAMMIIYALSGGRLP